MSNMCMKANMKRLDGVKVTAKFAIGHGAFADIYPGIWTIDAISGLNVDVGTVHIYIAPPPHSRTLPRIKVVIKVFRIAQIKENTPELQQKHRLEKECGLWADLRHPNVLAFFGLLDDPAIPFTGLVSPRCTSGDLHAFFSDPATAFVERLPIVKGIAEGLTYMHEKNVVHGDLTMRNVLIEVIDGKFTPLISDFGRSRILDIAGYTTPIGEIHLAEDDDRTTKAFTKPADVWCFGMAMLETLSGKEPFFYLSEYKAAQAVATDREIPDQNCYPALPHGNAYWKIMGKCWHWEPSHREEIGNLLQDLNTLSE
ncbi:uncharacterized protein LACBIDRAFT_332398 [Laccaria bicolor S238N-H82]|uniref:Predicted protein n=1 Tax=Laccaria bicolor (strain S238N-H82 / ATCC MYA-4686) TaxID=486041 RepID=B0DSL2_LACBS|nr:uncharacterized protein LACBIDRAFT_332398 [Laccaria bicolor S238N-H82]EDR02568.1 predicted protein [Laccaria bicolor S238N-H82]|eukprot:XP_001886931.1 predicted protein [Laccaria bicolor S238N-H82]